MKAEKTLLVARRSFNQERIQKLCDTYNIPFQAVAFDVKQANHGRGSFSKIADQIGLFVYCLLGYDKADYITIKKGKK